MKKMNWKYVKELDDHNAVRSFLDQYKIKLPADLIILLETYNGGRPAENDIVTVNKREYVFKALLSYNQHDRETIYNVYPDLFEDTDLYPIATDPAGNYICYKCGTDGYVLLNHETNKEEIISEIPCLP